MIERDAFDWHAWAKS